MSIVLYVNDGKTKRLFADSLMGHGEMTYCVPEKIKKISDRLLIGGVGSSDLSYYVKATLPKMITESENIITLREKFVKICSDYNYEENDAEFLISLDGRVYNVTIRKNKVDTCLDVTDHDYFGIGYWEMVMGAVICGYDPVKAIERISDRNRYLSKPVYEYVIDEVK